MFVLDADDIQRAGLASIAEILQRLPANANALNLQFNRGAGGLSRVNLRSLDDARTLVLLNGRRFVPGGDGADASVNLNAVPLSIVERIEIMTGGASAAYGSDAVAGVVNIITPPRPRGRSPS